MFSALVPQSGGLALAVALAGCTLFITHRSLKSSCSCLVYHISYRTLLEQQIETAAKQHQMYWTAIRSNGEAVTGKDGAPLRSLRLDSDELEAMMAPCRGPVDQDYEVARRSDPTGWGSKEGIQSLAGAFLSTVTLQPICCAPDSLLPPNMTNKAYDLVRIDTIKPNLKLHVTGIQLACYSPAGATPCKSHTNAVPAVLWKPQLWICEKANRRGHPTLLFRFRGSKTSRWSHCLSCADTRQRQSNDPGYCTAPDHWLEETIGTGESCCEPS